MSLQHKDLAAGRWKEMSFVDQMANIGSEVERALNWRAKNNASLSQKALERALELLDLSLDAVSEMSRLKELARIRETMVDFFIGTNEFKSSEILWKRYFLPFAYASRLKH